MNALDIILLIFIILPAIFAFKKGFLKTIFSYIGLIVGIILAVKFNTGFSVVVKYIIRDPKISQILSFILIVVCIYLISIFIASKISKINVISEMFDKIAGGIFGLLKGILFTSLLLILCDSFSLIPQKQRDNSLLFPHLTKAAPYTYNAVKDYVPLSKKDFNQVLNFLVSDSLNTKK